MEPDRASLLAVHRQDRVDEFVFVQEVDGPDQILLHSLERPCVEPRGILALVREEEARRVHPELSHDAQDDRAQ